MLVLLIFRLICAHKDTHNKQNDQLIKRSIRIDLASFHVPLIIVDKYFFKPGSLHAPHVVVFASALAIVNLIFLSSLFSPAFFFMDIDLFNKKLGPLG